MQGVSRKNKGLREITVMCAWCGKELCRKPGLGQSGVSHGICPDCKRKHFPKVKGGGGDEAA